jgi:hypothetical protein
LEQPHHIFILRSITMKKYIFIAFMPTGFLTPALLKDCPDSKWKMPVTSISYAVAVVLPDAIAGAATGSLHRYMGHLGYLVPAPYLNRQLHNTGIAIAPS